MNYEPNTTKDSTALPGVRYTIREISEGQRRRLRRELAPAYARLADIDVEREEFYARLCARFGKPTEEITVPELTASERREFTVLNDRIDEINDVDVHPAYFRAGFVAVEGLGVGGKSAFTADELIECGPPALVREITRAINLAAGLEDAEKANLSSPSTSTAAVEGRTKDTTAANASAPAGTPAVTADASLAA